jgi:hypothetical protein
MHMRCTAEHLHDQNYPYNSKCYGPRGAGCDGSQKQHMALHALRLEALVELFSCVTDILETTSTKAFPKPDQPRLV